MEHTLAAVMANIMSESLFACLRNYMNAVRYSENDTGLLFRNRWGKAYRPNSILQKYKKLLEEAGIPCTASGKLPRLHDLRHTFAVHALEGMAAQGIDMYVSIPYLEEYMGHLKRNRTWRWKSSYNAGIKNFGSRTVVTKYL